MPKPVSSRGDHVSRRHKKGVTKPKGGANIPDHDILVLARGTPAHRVINGVLAGTANPKGGHKPSTVILTEERDGARAAPRKVFPITFGDAARMLSHADSLSGSIDDFGFFEVTDSRAGIIRQIASQDVVELVRA